MLCALPAVCEPGYQTETYVYGTVDLLLPRHDGRAVEINRQRRADNPFGPLRVNLFADIVTGDRLVIFNQAVIDPSARASINSFLRTWARVTVVESSGFDLHLQLGKIPTPFGHFTERSYTDTNPLLGYPLMYHYSTSLRANQLPMGNADLLAHRGEGLSEGFSGYAGGGAAAGFSGLPLIYDSCWDFGGGAIGSLWRFEYLLAVTKGTLGDPRSNVTDNNDGQQIAARLGFVPAAGVLIRASYARGPYLDRQVGASLPAGRQVEDYVQEIAGLSAELEYRHLSVVGELAANRWESPFVVDGDGRRQDLEVTGFYAEGRYKLRPGLFAAARWSGLRFGDIDDGSGVERSWDYDTTRLELGLGYWVTDGVLGKLAAQLNDLNRRDTENDHILATQLSVRF
jgi:hypothetical protein